MKMRFRKKYFLTAVSMLMISVAAASVAFFTGSDLVTNRLSGRGQNSNEDDELKISVTEQFDPPEEKDNEAFRKNVQIQNNGNTDCYVRVRLEFSSSDIRDITWLSNDADKDNESTYVRAADYPDSRLPDGWEYRAQDGFYYFTRAVTPGGTTGSLIKWVKTVFPDIETDETEEYDIFVYSEAVNAYDENGDRLSYEEAWI